MNNKEYKSIDKKFNNLIIVVSIIIPIVVAILFSIKLKDFGIKVAPLNFLPPIYATINGITALLLIAAVVSIKNGKRKLHETLMTIAILCSIVFLIMYVAYHLTANSTKFGDSNHDGIVDAAELAIVGSMRIVYFLILISHIALSVIIIPLVLFTYAHALAEKFDKHKKLAKITFPIWLYVAVTGVVVFLMISPYYAK
jgi:putative membrane protein